MILTRYIECTRVHTRIPCVFIIFSFEGARWPWELALVRPARPAFDRWSPGRSWGAARRPIVEPGLYFLLTAGG